MIKQLTITLTVGVDLAAVKQFSTNDFIFNTQPARADEPAAAYNIEFDECEL
jgi:hypothetical protein